MTVRQLIQYLMDLALEDPKVLNYKVRLIAEGTLTKTFETTDLNIYRDDNYMRFGHLQQ